MKSNNSGRIAAAITQAVANNEEKVWVWIGAGYVLDQEALQKLVKKTLEDF